jgi:hypothetical protein
MNFSWSKAFGFGVLIWAILFVVGAILVGIGVSLSTGWLFVLALVGAVLSYSFATNADPATVGSAWGYGIMWALIGLILDVIITQQFEATEYIFSQWSYWLGYAFILLAPWVEAAAHQTTQSPRTPQAPRMTPT